jgi:thymidine phosphorylase
MVSGSTHLIIDIPVGSTAKVRHMRQALALRKLFEFVGDQLNIHLEVMITDGRQPRPALIQVYLWQSHNLAHHAHRDQIR